MKELPTLRGFIMQFQEYSQGKDLKDVSKPTKMKRKGCHPTFSTIKVEVGVEYVIDIIKKTRTKTICQVICKRTRGCKREM